MLTLATAALGFSLSSSVPFVQAASRGASAIAMASQDELKKQVRPRSIAASSRRARCRAILFSDFKALSRSQVGYKAVDDYVKSGMVVGLGTGSTAAFAVERVGHTEDELGG